MALPLVSIITPSLNQGRFIEAAILSVLDQTYPNIEYLVLDGGSTDDTLDILRRYENRLRWWSAADDGQADAINQGMRRARGAILAWLNADDLLVPGAVQTVVDYFQTQSAAAFVYGDAEALDAHGRSYGLRIHVHQTSLDELVNVVDAIVQPTAFWRREVWETVGELDTALHYALDYEYWMRVARQFELVYLPVCLARERLYGGAKTARGQLERLHEIELVARRHGGSGLPRNYRAEAAAAYTRHSLSALTHGDGATLRRDLAQAFKLRPALWRWLYYSLISLFGGDAQMRAGLITNWLRRARKRSVAQPNL